MQGVPAIAVSLDNYKALTPEGFKAGAAYVVALVKAGHLLTEVSALTDKLCAASLTLLLIV